MKELLRRYRKWRFRRWEKRYLEGRIGWLIADPAVCRC